MSSILNAARRCGLALVLAITLAMGIGGRAAAESFESLVGKADPAVGRVIAKTSDGLSLGSGFLLSRSRNGRGWYFLTNNHVIAGATRVMVGFDDATGVRQMPAEIVRRSAGRDLAVLLLSAPEDGRPFLHAPLPLAERLARKGETVAALGFPGTADTFSDTAHEALFQTSLTTGTISRVFNGSWQNEPAAPRVDILQHTAGLNPGNSGGPLLDTCGAVLGINTALTAFSDGGKLAANDTFWASSSTTAIAYLSAQDIPFAVATGGCGGEVIRADAIAAPPAGGVWARLPDLGWLNWTEAALLMLLTIGGGGFALWRGGAARAQAKAASRAGQPHLALRSARAKPMLVLVTSTGQRRPLQADELRQGISLGRDPSANLTITDPSVSRTHAELRLDGRRLMLRDLGSTNGSFAGGTRLAPHAECQINLEMPLRLGGVSLSLQRPEQGE